MIEVTVQLSAEVAEALRRPDNPSSALNELLLLAQEYGTAYEELHSGTDDAQLSRYFEMRVADERIAEELLARLRKRQGVEAAYIKPPGEPPSP